MSFELEYGYMNQKLLSIVVLLLATQLTAGERRLTLTVPFNPMQVQPQAIAAAPQQTIAHNTTQQKYNAMHKLAMQTDKPMLILTGASWCGGCRVMHNNMAKVLLNHKDQLHLYIDSDENKELSNYFTNAAGTTMIPLLSVYRWDKSVKGWIVKHYKEKVLSAPQIDQIIKESQPQANIAADK